MVKRNKRAKQLEFNLNSAPAALTFSTLKSSNETLDVSVQLPFNTHWRINYLRNGVYLEQTDRIVENPTKWKISNYLIKSRQKKFLSIQPRIRNFTIYSNDMVSLLYKFENKPYVNLGSAINFIHPEFPTFRYIGNLEFVILV